MTRLLRRAGTLGLVLGLTSASAFALTCAEYLRPYQAAEDLQYRPPLALQSFVPAQGWRVTHRDAKGRAIRGRLRVMSPFSEIHGEDPRIKYFVVGEFNDWGKKFEHELAPYQLRPDPEDGAYLNSPELPLRHGTEYLILRRDRNRGDTLLLDPANNAYTTPTLLKKLGRPVHQNYNSLFWDMGGPDHYALKHPLYDWRKVPGGRVIIETDLIGLVKKWRHGKQEGPPSDDETYNFVADSGIIPFLKKHGVSQVKLMPNHQQMELPGWQWGYQTYPFAINCNKGTPAEFARMVDTFHANGIGVILDAVVGHFPKTDNLHGSARSIDGKGLHQWTDQNGRMIYGSTETEWKTFAYNMSLPEVRRYLVDSAVDAMKNYGVTGFRLDNVTGGPGQGFYNRPGGAAYVQEFNRALRLYHPGAYTNAEAFSDVDVMVKRPEAGGAGFTTANHGYLFHVIHKNFALLSDQVDMHAIAAAIDEPLKDNRAMGTTYVVNHDEADNGQSFPAERVAAGGTYYVRGKSKAYGMLAMLSGADYLSMLQMELGQGGYFENGYVWWPMLKNPTYRELFEFFGEANRVYSSSPAFHVSVMPKKLVNHVDHQNKVLSQFRENTKKGETIFAVFNLGDTHVGTSGGIPRYRVGIPKAGTYELILDSEASHFGGHSKLITGLKLKTSRVASTRHGSKQELILPHLAPFQVLIFRRVGD